MKFMYILDSYGWADVKIEHENFKKIYPVEEWMSDDLTDLLGGIIALTGYGKEEHICDTLNNKYLIKSYDLFEWILDIGSEKNKFIFKKTEDINIINLQILENHFDDITEKEIIDDCVFNYNINFNELIDNILVSCSNILKKYGIIGYALNFWLEFPVSLYLILKDYRNKKNLFNWGKVNDNDKEEYKQISNLEDEIEYLNC